MLCCGCVLLRHSPSLTKVQKAVQPALRLSCRARQFAILLGAAPRVAAAQWTLLALTEQHNHWVRLSGGAYFLRHLSIIQVVSYVIRWRETVARTMQRPVCTPRYCKSALVLSSSVTGLLFHVPDKLTVPELIGSRRDSKISQTVF